MYDNKFITKEKQFKRRIKLNHNINTSEDFFNCHLNYNFIAHFCRIVFFGKVS